MTTEAYPIGIERDGDFLPPDSESVFSEEYPLRPGIEVDDRPELDAEPEIDNRPLEEEQAQRARIHQLLLEAKEWTAKAGARKIRTATRKTRHAEASRRVKEADSLIAELLNLDPENPDNSAAIISVRVRMRQEAVAEMEVKKAAELGRRAALAAESRIDVQKLAANDRDED